MSRGAVLLAGALAACAAPDVRPLGLDVEVLEAPADPAVVTDPGLRRAIATGLPWRVRHRPTGIELLLVPPMTFTRGAAPEDAEAAANERPAHPVAVNEPFYLGRHEVSGAEWAAVMGERPGFFSGAESGAQSGGGDGGGDGADLPVESVSCFAAEAFARTAGLALPTESQWEAACRAGDPRPRYGDLDEVAWHRGNSAGRPNERGKLRPNALGFHDMLGNVWEWTRSGYSPDEYARHGDAAPDARGRVRGSARVVLRGGSWFDPPKRARASARYATERDLTAGHVGLRVALELTAVPGATGTGTPDTRASDTGTSDVATPTPHQRTPERP